MSRYNKVFLILCISLFNACAPKQQNPALNAAELLHQQGQPQKAAELYQHWAETQPNNEIQYRLKAIELLIEAGNGNSAKPYADTLQQENLSPEQQSLLALLYAEISLSFGEAEQALKHLKTIDPELFDSDQKIKLYKTQAFTYALTGNLADSVISRILLHDLLPAEEQQKNNTALFEALSLLTKENIQYLQNHAAEDLAGWLDLALILKHQAIDAEAYGISIEQWRERFPSHPADPELLRNYSTKPLNSFAPPSRLAVLLPDTGSYARAAQAIHEGFMTAYYRDTNPNKPSVRFYNSETDNIGNLYHQAIAEGAQLVIGPLSKNNIKQLSLTSNFNTPVLALNQVTGLSKSNFFQFGLNPEDEADQITSQAILDGHKKALILTPNTSQGQRIARLLSEHWQQANGTVLETQRYDTKSPDFSAPIKLLLNLNESRRRYQQIKKLIPLVNYTPRRRQDVDAIFLNADNSTARQINPQLRFYHANHVPVYAMPDVYTGINRPHQDIDLNNVTFCDAPWLFSESYQGNLSRATLQQSDTNPPEQHLRLFAMGIDAYQLIAQLGSLDNIQFQGATGNLLLDPHNKIKRNLTCAKFIQGVPVVLGQGRDQPETALQSDETQEADDLDETNVSDETDEPEEAAQPDETNDITETDNDTIE